MHPSEQDTDQHEEELVRRVLEAVGSRHALPEDLRDRWETTFRADLQQVIDRKTRVRRGVLGALAASIAAVAIAFVLLDSPPAPLQPVAEATFVDGRSQLLGVGPVRVGMTLTSGQSVQTRAGSYVTMNYHGADVRVGVDSVVRLHANRLELVRGDIYVDTGASASAMLPVLVETELGTLSHVGTQFLVNFRASRLTAAVREGTIILITKQGDDLHYAAEEGRATVVRVSNSGKITFPDPEATSYGELWDWVLEASPGFTAEGPSISHTDLLKWVAREKGQTIKYENDAVRADAEDYSLIVVAGQSISIEQALDMLNKATDLGLDTKNGAELRVAKKPST